MYRKHIAIDAEAFWRRPDVNDASGDYLYRFDRDWVAALIVQYNIPQSVFLDSCCVLKSYPEYQGDGSVRHPVYPYCCGCAKWSDANHICSATHLR